LKTKRQFDEKKIYKTYHQKNDSRRSKKVDEAYKKVAETLKNKKNQ
jgi:hypothetical protein